MNIDDLKDDSVIKYVQGMMNKAGIYKTLGEVYDKLLSFGLINKDGTVSKKAIKDGLIETQDTIKDAPKVNTHPVDKMMVKKGFTSLKYIDPTYYYKSNQSAKPDDLFRMRIDAYVQQTLQPELSAKITLAKLYISILNSTIIYNPNDNDNNKCLRNQINELKDYIANLTILHIPDYDSNSITYDVIFTKIAELRVLPTINDDELKDMVKAHVQLACRNYINGSDDKNKALDSINTLLNTAKAMRSDIKELAGF